MAGLTQTALLKFLGDAKGATSAINTVGAGLKGLNTSAKSATGALSKAGTGVTNTFGRLQGVLKKTQMAVGGVANSIRLFSQGITNVGRAVMFFIGMPLAAFMTAGFTAAISFEDALIRVKKTTNLTNQEMVVLTQQIRDIAKETASSHVELATMAEQLGQLGVKSAQAIPQYVRLFDMIATATDVGSDEVVKSVGRIATAFGWSLDDSYDSVYRLSNVINVLENNTAASASEIINALGNSAQAASLLGLASYDIAALDAALISAGLSADEAGTAMRNLILKLAQHADKVAAIMEGTEKYATAQSVLNALNEDATSVILDVIGAMAQEDDRAMALAASIDVLGIRGGKALSGLSVSFDNVVRIMGLASAEWENATSLMREYEQAMLSTQSQLKVLKNNMNDAGITLANSFLPVINRIVQYAIPAIQELTKAFDALPFKTKAIAMAMVLLTIAMGPLLFFVGQLSHGITLMVLGGQALIGAIASMVGAIGSLLGGLIALNPAAIAAAAALAAGAGVIMKVLQRMGVNVAGFFTELAADALAWGENLATTYGQGLISGAANAIAAALAWISNLIASFLEAHSPPEQGPLSHIDKWGKTLIDTYLMSFMNADFGILRSIGRTIQSIFASFAAIGKIGEGQEFKFALEARTALAKLISIFNETGKVAEDVLSEVVSKLGEAADEVEELIRRQLEYNALINELQELSGKRSDAIAAYKEELKLIMASTMSAEEKAEAIRQAKLERDKELNVIAKEAKAAEDQVDAAKERVEWQEALIGAMSDQDALQQRMIATMERMAKAAAAMGGGGGGGGGAGGGDGFGLPDPEEIRAELEKALEPIVTLRERINTAKGGWDIFMEGVKGNNIFDLYGPAGLSDVMGLDPEVAGEWEHLNEVGLKINDIWSDVTGFFEGLGTSMEGFDLSEVVGNIDIKQILMDVGFSEAFIDYFAGEFAVVSDWFSSIDWGKMLGDVGAGIGGAFESIRTWFTDNWPTIQATIITAWEVLKGIFSSAAATIAPALQDLKKEFDKLFAALRESGALTFLVGVLKVVAAILGGVVLGAFAVIVGVVKTAIYVFGDFVAAIRRFIDAAFRIGDGLKGIWEGIQQILGGDLAGGLATIGAGVKEVFGGIIDLVINSLLSIADVAKDVLFGLVGGIVEFVLNLFGKLTGNTEIGANFGEMLTKVLDFDITDWATEFIGGIPEALSSAWTNVTAWVSTKGDEWKTAWEGLKGKASEALSGVGEAITTKLTEIGTSFTESPLVQGLGAQLTEAKESFTTAFADISAAAAEQFGPGTPIYAAVEGIKGLFSTVGGKLSAFFGPIIEGVRSKISGLITIVKGHVSTALGFLKGIGKGISLAFRAALQVIGQVLGAVVKVVFGYVKLAFQYVSNLVSGVVGGIVGVAKAIGTKVWAAIKTIVSGIFSVLVSIPAVVARVLLGIGTFILKLVANAIRGVGALLNAFVLIITGGFDFIQTLITEKIPEWIESFTEFVAGAGEALVGIRDSIVEALAAAWEGVVTWFEETKAAWIIKWEEIKSSIGEALSDMWESVVEHFDTFWAGLVAWVETKQEEIATLWNVLKFAAAAAWDDFWTGIEEKLAAMWESFIEWKDTKKEEFLVFWQEFPTKAYEALSTMWETVVVAFTEFWLSLSEWFSAAYIGIVAAFGTFATKAYEGLKDLWTKVKERFQEITTGLKGRGEDSVIGGIIKSVKQVGEDIMTAIKESLKEFGQKALDYILGLAQRIAEIVAGIMDNIAKAASGLGVGTVQQGNSSSGDGETPVQYGGEVSANSSYLVGEVGPELFIPGRSGVVIPNSMLDGVGGGASVLVEMHVHDPVVRDEQDIDRLAEEIMDRLGEALGDSMRFGGSRF